jgi:hypothetical protein
LRPSKHPATQKTWRGFAHPDNPKCSYHSGPVLSRNSNIRAKSRAKAVTFKLICIGIWQQAQQLIAQPTRILAADPKRLPKHARFVPTARVICAEAIVFQLA